jgi:putative DNA primase/helicase
MGIILKDAATDRGSQAPVDWGQLKRDILAKVDIAEEFRSLGVRFTKPVPNAKGWLECHAVGRPDDDPSAAVNVGSGVYCDRGGEGESVHLFEFALRHGDFGRWVDVIRHYAAKAGVPFGRVDASTGGRIREAIYFYRDEDGAVRYAVFRYRLPNGKKSFTQHPPDGRGGWKAGVGCMDGVAPLPYRLPELEAASEAIVWILEGEKDCDRAASAGLVATTNHQGAQSTDRTWPYFLDHFRGRDCRIVPDNDPGGRAHARRVAGYLLGVARSIRIVELPDCPPKGDLSDWLDSGHDTVELATLADAAPEWTGDQDAPEAEDADESDVPDEVVVTVCLDDVVPVPVEWLVPGRIPLGKLTLLAGDPKLGKSFLTMDLAARVSTAGEVPCGGGECMSLGSVVLLSAEDDLDDTIKPRLVAAGADARKIHALTTVRLNDGRLGPFTLAYIPHLEHAIARFRDTRLVIIDPVTHYIGNGTDDHKNTQLRTILGPLKDLAKRAKVAILIVTHLNKGSSPKALTRVTGSLAYTAMARANWLIAKDPEDPRRRLMLSIGNNLVEDPSGLAYRIVEGRVAWEDKPVLMDANDALAAEQERRPAPGPKENASKVEQAEAWLADLLAKGDPVPSDDVFSQGDAKGFKRKVLFEAKERMGIKARKEGFGSQGQWFWVLPPAQQQAEAGEGPPF